MAISMVVVVFVFVAATAATSVVVVVVVVVVILLLPLLQIVGWATIYNWWSIPWLEFGKFIPLEIPEG
jgi:hypothetical protein